MQPPELDPKDLMELATASGQQRLIEFFADFRTVHGPEWLADLQETYPTISWIAELVTTKTADEAHAEIVKLYPLAAFAGTQIKALHARLLEEIEKKR